jgi:hypothetical protein
MNRANPLRRLSLLLLSVLSHPECLSHLSHPDRLLRLLCRFLSLQ